MKNKEYNFLITFIYGLYFVLIGHYVMTEDKSIFLSYYSEWGIYTFFSLLTIHSILQIPQLKNKPMFQMIKQKRFAYIMVSFLMAHFIDLFHPLLKIANYLSELLFWDQTLIMFIIGILMFLWGAFLLKKGADQKILITVCMLLFIHGFYNCLFLVSLKKQFSSYENVYESVVKNNINFESCAKEVSCIKIPEKDRKEIFQSIGQSESNQYLKSLISIYMKNLSHHIDNNKADITVYSYLYSPIDFTQGYQPMGVYSKKNGYLIIDYRMANKITNDHINTYKRLLGTATIMWLSLLLFLNFFHDVFLKYRLRSLAKKQIEIEKSKESNNEVHDESSPIENNKENDKMLDNLKEMKENE